MKCKQFCEIISAYVDSEASALEQVALREHIKTCEVCKNELASLYTLKQMVKGCHCVGSHSDVSISVMSRIMNNDTDLLMENAINVDVPSKGNIRRSHWAVAALVCVLTATAVFSAHKINSQNQMLAAANDNVRDYTTFIYEHLNTPDMSYTASTNTQLNRVSFIK